MAKEAKIGLAVIGLLLIILAGSAWWRFARWQRGRIADKASAVAGQPRPVHPNPAQPLPAETSPVASAVPIRAVPLETAVRMPNRPSGWSAPATSPEAPSGPSPLPEPGPAPPAGTTLAISVLNTSPSASRGSHPLAITVQPDEPSDPPGAEELMPPGMEPEIIPVQATEPVRSPPPSQQPGQGQIDPFTARHAGEAMAAAGDRYAGVESAPMPESAPQDWNAPAAPPLLDTVPNAEPRPSSIYQNRGGQAPLTPTSQRNPGRDAPPQMLGGPSPGMASSSLDGMPPGMAPGAEPAGLQPDGTYRVEPNDNYWRISEKFYGTGAYFKALAEHNRKQIENPERLQVGERIEIPAEADLQANYGDLCPKPSHLATPGSGTIPVSYAAGGRTYVVEEGDTLFDIARHELGSPARWKEIYDLNRTQLSEDFNHLRPGTQLMLPPDASSPPEPAGTLTRRLGGAIER